MKGGDYRIQYLKCNDSLSSKNIYIMLYLLSFVCMQVRLFAFEVEILPYKANIKNMNININEVTTNDDISIVTIMLDLG